MNIHFYINVFDVNYDLLSWNFNSFTRQSFRHAAYTLNFTSTEFSRLLEQLKVNVMSYGLWICAHMWIVQTQYFSR